MGGLKPFDISFFFLFHRIYCLLLLFLPLSFLVFFAKPFQCSTMCNVRVIGYEILYWKDRLHTVHGTL